MQMIIYEVKKMYLHHKGLVFLALFVLLSFLLLFASDKSFNPALEENKSQYTAYLDVVKGNLSTEKEQFLTDESRSLNEGKASLNKLYDNFYDGQMSEDDFDRERIPLEELLSNQDGFELIFEQYVYVRENPSQRFMLYRNGWDALLSNDSLDFLLILIILLLVTPVFCHEYDTSMDSLSITTKKGGKQQAICKIVLVLISVLVLSLISISLRYVFFDLKYGLDNGDYPLQSLSYFSTATKNLSLTETFIFVSSLKTLGFLSFAMAILFLSVCIKRYAFTLFSSIALIVIPFIGMGASTAKYLFTGPLGLMLGTGFFRGDIYVTDRFMDGTQQVFKEITPHAILILVAAVFSILALMMIIIAHLRSNVWNTRSDMKIKRDISISLLLCLIISASTGCAAPLQGADYPAYNLRSSMSYENTDYRFYVDDSDIANVKIVFEDKVTGEVRDFVRTPFQSSTNIAWTVYGNGSYVYYMKYSLDKSEFREVIDRVFVVEVDTRTFDEQVIFEKNIKLDNKIFMDTIPTNNADMFFLHAAHAFFVDAEKQNIYFIADDIRQVNIKTGKVTIINVPTNRSVAFDGVNIYFIGDRYQLSCYNTRMDEYGEIPGIITTKFYLSGEKLLFLNRFDQKKLYELSLEDLSMRKILDKTALDFYCDKDFIYYQDIYDLAIHSVPWYNVLVMQDKITLYKE